MASATTPKPPARKTAARKPAKPAVEATLEPDETDLAVPTPSEVLDEKLDQDALMAELLGDLPELTPAYRLRARQRAGFDRLKMHATVGGVFTGDGILTFDMTKPGDVKRYDAFLEFVAEIDEWAESIAYDQDAYAEWSAGKTGEHFMAIFMDYQVALGESRGSAS